MILTILSLVVISFENANSKETNNLSISDIDLGFKFVITPKASCLFKSTSSFFV